MPSDEEISTRHEFEIGLEIGLYIIYYFIYKFKFKEEPEFFLPPAEIPTSCINETGFESG